MIREDLINNPKLFSMLNEAESGGFQELSFWRYDGKCSIWDPETKKSYNEDSKTLLVLYEDSKQLIFCLDGWNNNGNHLFIVPNPSKSMKKIQQIYEVKL